MKKILLSVAAVASLAVALPAMAQPYGGGGRHEANYNINQRQAEIARRIDRGQRDGSLSLREARRMRVELSRIESLEHRYRRAGLQGWERADLDRRLDALSRQVFAERHDRDNRRY
jgi:hypothetical protein